MSSVLLTVALGLALWIALPAALPDWRPTLVSSGSMAPLVNPGDVVLVRDVEASEIPLGAVVLYDLPGTGPVLHRVVDILDDGSLITRGDANQVADTEPVGPDQVRGAAVLDVPGVGLPSLWLSRGDVPRVALAATVMITAVALAPRSLDPRFDPWPVEGPGLPGDLVLAPRMPVATVPVGRLLPAAVADALHTLLGTPGPAVPMHQEDPR